MEQGEIGLLLVDDEPFVRRVLRSYVANEPDIRVLGECADGAEALARARELNPDVVVMDLQMPGTDGIEATRQIVEAGLAARVLVVTGHVSHSFLTESLLSGASGYIVKDSEPHQVVDAIRGVHAGGMPIDPIVTQHLINVLRRDGSVGTGELAESRGRGGTIHVTDREQDVLEALCSGQSNREIACALFISEPTVKYYLTGLQQKFGTRGRVELVVSVLRRGLVR